MIPQSMTRSMPTQPSSEFRVSALIPSPFHQFRIVAIPSILSTHSRDSPMSYNRGFGRTFCVAHESSLCVAILVPGCQFIRIQSHAASFSLPRHPERSTSGCFSRSSPRTTLHGTSNQPILYCSTAAMRSRIWQTTWRRFSIELRRLPFGILSTAGIS